jgi:hypothetical protein
MTETPLFDGYEPPERPNVEVLSAGQRLTLRQAENASRGVHPLTRGPLHPEASRDATRGDKRNLPFTCGSCVHRAPSEGPRDYPKCLWRPTPDARMPFVTSGPATDCRGWWPACPQYQPMEETT